PILMAYKYPPSHCRDEGFLVVPPGFPNARRRAHSQARQPSHGRDALRPDNGGNSVRAYWRAPARVRSETSGSIRHLAQPRLTPDPIRCAVTRCVLVPFDVSRIRLWAAVYGLSP